MWRRRSSDALLARYDAAMGVSDDGTASVSAEHRPHRAEHRHGLPRYKLAQIGAQPSPHDPGQTCWQGQLGAGIVVLLVELEKQWERDEERTTLANEDSKCQ
jgi:hypothetical protein